MTNKERVVMDFLFNVSVKTFGWGLFLLAIVMGFVEYECLNRGNWIGAFFTCPVIIYICLKGHYNLVEKK